MHRGGRIKGGKEMFHQDRKKRSQFFFHSFAKHFQGVKHPIDTFGYFLVVFQLGTCIRQVRQQNWQDIICKFVNVGLKMFGKLANCIKRRISDTVYRVLDSSTYALNKSRQIFCSNVFCTTFSNNSQS